MHKSLIGLGFVVLLAGCSGNTYGTGVSSEKQLVDDIGHTLTLDMNRKSAKINYPSRPSLVKPPTTAQLPTPAETVAAESAYFPEDPEVKRQRLLAELAEADANGLSTRQLSPELQRMRAESLERGKNSSGTDKYANLQRSNDGDCFLCDFYDRTEGNKRRLAEKTAARQLAATKKRRYLTEPPSEYNKPAETAEMGNLGEEELSEEAIARQKAQKKKKGFFDGLFGG